MAPSAPLQLLFNQTLAELRKNLFLLIEADQNLSIDPVVNQSGNISILYQGILSFELAVQSFSHSLSGFRTLFIDRHLPKNQTAIAIDFGPHLAGGNHVPPLARALLTLGATLATQLSAHAVIWYPAKIISDVSLFADSVDGYANGGIFPVMATVDFEYSDQERAINSMGLSWFSGQEIAIGGCDIGGQDLVRRAIRIIHDVAVNGAIILQQDVPDLASDNLITLTPNKETNILLCEIWSKMDAKARAPSLH